MLADRISQPARKEPSPPNNLQTSRWEGLLNQSIFFLLCIFAICLPFSIKGSERAWRAAFVLWLIQLAISRKRPFNQPLTAPLLAYVTLTGISTALSTEPYLSWDRMKFVCLILVGILIGQTLLKLSQVRVLVLLFVLSGLAAAGFTAWQYTYGVGVQINITGLGGPLWEEGVRNGDFLTSVDGKVVHSPEQLVKAIDDLPADVLVPVKLRRGLGLEHLGVMVSRKDFIASGLGTPKMTLVRGKPFRAAGTLGHYVVFAEMLMQIGCMAWVLLFSTKRRMAWQVLFGFTFAAVTMALYATQARAPLAGMALGCMVALIMLSERQVRLIAAGLLIVVVGAGTLWIQHTRRVAWMDASDPGTQFRLLMWEDGVRLVKQHPWFGVGMETVRVHWQEWHIRGFEIFHVQSHFHSTWLQIAVERGLPALAAWVWFVVAYFMFLVRLSARARARSRFAEGVVAGVLAGFAGFTLTSFVHYNLGEEPLAMCLFFFFGLAVAIDRMLGQDGAIDVA